MDCHVIKFPPHDDTKFPYFVVDVENRVWLVKSEARRGYFNAVFAQGNASYRPFSYEGELAKSSIKHVLERSRLQINIGSPTDA